MRPGQQHNKRGRGRNRHRSGGGGGGGGGGGNPLSRVYDSNGPDVKVRGTAQTVAEKYLQLARDAQSSGDSVMAESYFQHAEHYLRILSEAQGYLQQQQQQFRRPGEEFDDEDGDESEGDGAEEIRPPQVAASGMGEQPDIQGEPPEFENARPPQQQNFRQNREYRDNQGNRDGQQQGRFRPRWQDRRDRNPNGGENRDQPYQAREQRPEEPQREQAAAPVNGNGDEAPQWEAPSFLRRPAPVVEAEAPVEESVAEKRPRMGRPRKERPVEDTPAPETQGE